MGGAVGPDHAVGHKIAVVGHIAEAASIHPVGFAGGSMHADAVVEPFPNKAPLQAVMLLECGVIVGQRAATIAHGVGVFTQNQGPRVIGGTDPFHDVADGGIHGGHNVGDGMPPLPMI